MYEHHSKPLLPKKEYYSRLLRNFFWGGVIVAISLLIGILGYHFTENLGWLDSLLNASMILTGMGPVDPMTTSVGKLFASFYAIFSGVVFLTTIAFVLAPVAHRFLHKFHLQDK
ncbi:MAG: hypothetical protein HY063_08420 [Bacteroidetes bacterium]|nr:hypothetical protein [Bacteroidota bacterium]